MGGGSAILLASYIILHYFHFALKKIPQLENWVYPLDRQKHLVSKSFLSIQIPALSSLRLMCAFPINTPICDQGVSLNMLWVFESWNINNK